MREGPIAHASGGRDIIRRAVDGARDHPVLAVFLGALGVRIVLAGAIATVMPSMHAPDEWIYHELARALSSGEASRWDFYWQALARTTAAYTFPLALLYVAVGPWPFGAQVIAALFGAGAAALTVCLAREVVPRRWAIGAGVAVAVLPSQVYFSSLALKDGAVWAVVAALAVAFARSIRSSRAALVRWTALVVLLLVVLAHLRTNSFLVACIAVALATWIASPASLPRRIVVGAAVLVVMPWLFGLGPAGSAYIRLHGSMLAKQRADNAIGAQSAFVAAPLRDKPAAQSAAASKAVRATRSSVPAGQTPAAPAGEPAGTATPIADAGPVDAEPGLAVDEATQPEARVSDAPFGSIGAARTTAEAPSSAASPNEVPEPAPAPTSAAVDGGDAPTLAPAASMPTDIPASPPPSDVPVSMPQGVVGPVTPDDSVHAGSSPGDLLRGLVAVVLAPFPWEPAESSARLFGKIDTAAVWYPLLILACAGLLRGAWRLRPVTFPLLYTLGTLTAYALVEGNVGTAFRHRQEATTGLVLLAVFALWRITARYDRSGPVSRSSEAAPLGALEQVTPSGNGVASAVRDVTTPRPSLP